MSHDQQSDNVNHPKHYNTHPSGVECITVVRHMGFNLGNAVKYIWRADEKGNRIEDLKKAAWYIADEIAKRELSPIPSQAVKGYHEFGVRFRSHYICPSCRHDNLRPAPLVDDAVCEKCHQSLHQDKIDCLCRSPDPGTRAVNAFWECGTCGKTWVCIRNKWDSRPIWLLYSSPLPAPQSDPPTLAPSDPGTPPERPANDMHDP